ncbi:MAG: GNAT family N-acetyltransferase [Candidatus Bathyarchaeota archaeon]|nr:GNAT family N-acetyltransferase [Candidatus Bathyarchaeota archaeon]
MFELGDIRFRPVEKDDLKLLHKWENDFELMMYSRSKPLNFVSMAQVERQYDEWMKQDKDIRFIVELVGTNEPIGLAVIRGQKWGNVKGADLGTYIGKKDLWGQGYGKQITVALLEMCFIFLNMERCQAWSIEYNTRARKTLEACGFKKGGVVRNTSLVNGRKWNSLHFDILREEYLSIRENLLRKTLGEKLDEYLKKHCGLAKNSKYILFEKVTFITQCSY